MIIDFEGEPGRPLRRAPLQALPAARRRRHDALVPLRDASRRCARAALRPEDAARAAAVGARVDGVGARRLPRRSTSSAIARRAVRARGDDARRSVLLDFYLLEKCIYEIGYELNNRPDWVEIPLRGLARADGGGEPDRMTPPVMKGPTQPSLLGALDVHLFNEGTHARLYDKLGSHIDRRRRHGGTYFAVWAPNAERVSVIGDFNGWDDTRAPLQGARRARASGRASSPASATATSTSTASGRATTATASTRPTRSRVRHEIAAEDRRRSSGRSRLRVGRRRRGWRSARSAIALDAPMSIYEVHLGSWMRVPEEGNRSLHLSRARAAPRRRTSRRSASRTSSSCR